MTRRRWIADEVSGNRAALTGDHAAHLVRVLRVRVGQEFDIATGASVRGGRVVSVADNRVEFELGENVSVIATPHLTLLLAIFKFDRFEWAIEKCTELSVARIIPVIARRTDAHLASAAARRLERWRKIALQAAEQSRRSCPPQIDHPLKLSQSLSTLGSLRILLSESEHTVLLRDIAASDQAEIILAVGPEGGWTDEELKLFRDSGWISASLGPTILRAETAAIAASAIAISAIT